MKVSIPKLHSVRLKSGGAQLRVFVNPKASDIITRDMLEDCRFIAAECVKDVAGYAIVAWDARGCNSSALRVVNGRYVGIDEAPAFVKDVLSGRIIRGD